MRSAAPIAPQPPRPLRTTVRTALAGGIGGLVLALVGTAAPAEQRLRLVAPEGVAVGGFDPVAYFSDGRAVPGEHGIALRWRGVRWHFASPDHRAAFEADPKAFLPQFGGHCAVSVVTGHPVPGDPEHWIIVEGRLYLTAGAPQLAQFSADPVGMLQAARTAWTRRSVEAD